MSNSENEKNDSFNSNKRSNNIDGEVNENKRIKLSDIFSPDDINYLKNNSIQLNKYNFFLLNNQNENENNTLILQFNLFFKILDPLIPLYCDKVTDLTKISEELLQKLDVYIKNHPKKVFIKYDKSNSLLMERPSLFIPYREKNFNHLYYLCKNGILNHQKKSMSLTAFLENYKKYGPDTMKLPDQLDLIKLSLKYASLQYLEYKIMFDNIYKFIPIFIKTKNLPVKEFNKIFNQRLSLNILPLSEQGQIYNLIKRCYIDILEFENNYKVSEELKRNIMNISFEEDTIDSIMYINNKDKTIDINNNDTSINNENSQTSMENKIISMNLNKMDNDNLDVISRNNTKPSYIPGNNLDNDIIYSNFNQGSLKSINIQDSQKKTKNNPSNQLYLSELIKELNNGLDKVKIKSNNNQQLDVLSDNNLHNNNLTMNSNSVSAVTNDTNNKLNTPIHLHSSISNNKSIKVI